MALSGRIACGIATHTSRRFGNNFCILTPGFGRRRRFGVQSLLTGSPFPVSCTRNVYDRDAMILTRFHLLRSTLLLILISLLIPLVADSLACEKCCGDNCCEEYARCQCSCAGVFSIVQDKPIASSHIIVSLVNLEHAQLPLSLAGDKTDPPPRF
jgi:hypothetical protein